MQSDEVVLAFFRGRHGRDIARPTALADVLDSLAYLDLFLILEKFEITLDDVVGCQTVGELCELVARRCPPPRRMQLDDCA